MRNLNSARDSWQELKQYKTLQELREAVRLDERSSIATGGCRSACWKAFLIFESLDVTTWLRTLSSSRSAYNSLRAHCLRNVDKLDEMEAGYDPLGEDLEASPSLQSRQDEELRAEILQDVARCMPENLYFREPETQRMLMDILFIFCKLNPDVSYRQGMHEILAPILWVVERDAIDLGQSSKVMGEDATIVSVFDPEHIEHDTFALFGQVMQSAKNFYEQSTMSGKENPIVKRSQLIFNELLPKIDEELARHLEAIDIIPQVFLMRWIRLLFGREFAFDDMLTIWDVIFAEDPTLDIVNEFCLTMILRIRWQLIEADYNESLALLLNYPEVEEDFVPQALALDAVYLRDHMDYHGGSYLVSKYSGRPLYQTQRPSTPPAMQRKITAFSGSIAGAVSSTASASRASAPARNFEKILQSTAKDIYARSEKLGIGKAVRNAVDEVHKRAQEIRDTPTPSPPPRAHQQRRSQSSLGPYALQDRVKTLEERSKQLAKLLEGALGELMEYHKSVTASGEKNELEHGPPGAEDLGVAIAKVQFVQVYLDDPKLLLPKETQPEDDPLQRTEPSVEGKGMSEVKSNPPNELTNPPNASHVTGLADPSAFEDVDSNADVSRIPTPQIVVNQEISSADIPQESLEDKGPTSRPRLDQSSYSWMLDEPKPPAASHGRAPSSSTGRSSNVGSLFGGDTDTSVTTNTGVSQDDSFDIGSLRRGKR